MTEIEIKKCFAIDCSGSTGGESFYHNEVKEIIEKEYVTGDDFIIWESEAKFTTYNEYMKINRKKEGFGGTYPSKIFDLFKRKKIHYSKIILITDGQVDASEVQKCDRNYEEYKNKIIYDYAEVYLIGEKRYVNLSVGCPFTRYCPSKTILKSPNEEKIINEISSNDLKVAEKISLISTEAEFNQNFESLKNALTVRFIGTSGDVEIRKNLLLMQSRIVKNNAKRQKSSSKIDTLLKEKKFEEAKNELLNCFDSIGNEFLKKINLLIRMSDGAIKQIFDIDEIQTFQKVTATEAKEVDIMEIQDIPSSVENSKFECPISMENEVDPAILITVPEEYIKNGKIIPLLVGFNKAQTENIISCPYNALNNKEFMKKFNKCIDHAISLKQIREAEKSGNPLLISPITRRRIVGIIPLGESPEHVNAADWTLMKLISGGKNLGDKNIWFSIIWLLVKRKIFPYLSDVEDFLRAQVLYRFKNNLTSISLCGLPNLPQKKVEYGTAAWSCLMSTYLVPRIQRNLNLLLVHLFHYRALLEIVNLFEYKLPDDFENVVQRIVCLASLMRFFKKETKLLPFYKIGISQSSIYIKVPEDSPMKSGGVVGDLFLPVDGKINEDVRQICLNKLPETVKNMVKQNIISIDELAYIMTFVDTQKGLSDIEIEDLVQIKKISKSEVYNNWENYDENYIPVKVKICPKTMRPYYYVGYKTWVDCFAEKIDIDKMYISRNSDYGRFVCQYSKYPTIEELVLFTYRKYASKFNTLPARIIQICEVTLEEFSPVIKNIKPKKFAKLFRNSASIRVRIRLEKS